MIFRPWAFWYCFKINDGFLKPEKKRVMPQQKLKFYDIKAKKSFETDKYEVMEKNTARGPMLFAVATSPYTGIKVYRLLGKKK